MELQPSLERQKLYAVENSAFLDRTSKLAILSLVLMEIGQDAILLSTNREVDIDLDLVAHRSAAVVGHIYNIVSARIEVLCRPAVS
jgi:hypothetical protein